MWKTQKVEAHTWLKKPHRCEVHIVPFNIVNEFADEIQGTVEAVSVYTGLSMHGSRLSHRPNMVDDSRIRTRTGFQTCRLNTYLVAETYSNLATGQSTLYLQHEAQCTHACPTRSQVHVHTPLRLRPVRASEISRDRQNPAKIFVR
jgi:hypothetical protein